MFQIKAKAKGKDLLHFEIGDSCFNSPRKVKKACIKAIKQNKTHYTDPLGLPELRQAIAEKHKCKVENVAVCPANFSIFAAMSILCDEEVDYPVPGFPTYKAVANYLGLKKKLHAKVKIVNYPNNPTGNNSGTIDAKTLIRDNAYESMFYGGAYRQYVYEDVIDIYSFSKSHAMSGFRLGYMLGPKEFIDKVGLLIETTYSCLPEFIQYAGIEALKIGGYKMKELIERRKLMFDILNRDYECDLPEGGIYLWCKCKDGDKEFEKLLKQGIVCCPGSIFGKKDYIRFCFAKQIKEIKKLGELLSTRDRNIA